MESKIESAIRLKYSPLAVLWADEKPEDALQFKTGTWGCIMTLFAKAARGRTAVFDRETFSCYGAGVGLGFGNQYVNFPGGVECFCFFLSTGNDKRKVRNEVAEHISHFVRKDFLEDFLNGEGYMKTPELVGEFVKNMPMMDIPRRYVVLKALGAVDPRQEEPVTVVFLVNPDQLSALVVLAHYGSGGGESVIALTDISARKYMRNQLGRDFLSFAVPFKMFREMESNVEGSFLEKRHGKNSWKGRKTGHEPKQRDQQRKRKENKHILTAKHSGSFHCLQFFYVFRTPSEKPPNGVSVPSVENDLVRPHR